MSPQIEEKMFASCSVQKHALFADVEEELRQVPCVGHETSCRMLTLVSQEIENCRAKVGLIGSITPCSKCCPFVFCLFNCFSCVTFVNQNVAAANRPSDGKRKGCALQ
jgi:hypothetical protein